MNAPLPIQLATSSSTLTLLGRIPEGNLVSDDGTVVRIRIGENVVGMGLNNPTPTLEDSLHALLKNDAGDEIAVRCADDAGHEVIIFRTNGQIAPRQITIAEGSSIRLLAPGELVAAVGPGIEWRTLNDDAADYRYPCPTSAFLYLRSAEITKLFDALSTLYGDETPPEFSVDHATDVPAATPSASPPLVAEAVAAPSPVQTIESAAPSFSPKKPALPESLAGGGGAPAATDARRIGATPEEWRAFSSFLTPDLLPNVADQKAKVSKWSKLKTAGKTPTRFDKHGEVIGIPEWSTKQSTPEEVAAWSKEPRYNICIQTRKVRALDSDVTDQALAAVIDKTIARVFGKLPKRTRSNSPKCLFAFELPGDFSKRVLKTKHGMVEFLAGGQHFVAAGTHTSDARYEWEGGTPTSFPYITEEQFEELWSALVAEFAIEPPTEAGKTNRHEKLVEAAANDPVAIRLHERGLVLSQDKAGRIDIDCPFKESHTTGESVSATSYFAAHTHGYPNGFLKCFHGHCSDRPQSAFLAAIGITAADDFAVIPDDPTEKGKRFRAIPVSEFAQTAAASWFVKGVLPDADLVVVYGETQSGKSFWVFDLAAHIARGIPYRGKKTQRSHVTWIAAEGSGGFRNRLKAYEQHNKISLTDLDISVIAAAPNFMLKNDVREVRDAILALPVRPALIVVDTLSAVTPGSNENSSEDMGKTLGHCQMLRAATGAMIVLIHHSGKDATKGARGWSGLRAAADAEFEITRAVDDRAVRITKLKDGEDGQAFGFKLVTVPVGMDDDGEVTTSCVVVPTVAVERSKRKLEPRGINEKRVWQAVLDLSVAGEPTVADVIDEALKNTPKGEGRKDNRRPNLFRALDSLEEGNRVRVVDGLVLLA